MLFNAAIVIILLFVYQILCQPEVTIINQEYERDENGYKFSYITSDGQRREETGQILKIDNKEILKVSGSFSYIGTDGRTYTVNYEADENGYQLQKINGEVMLRVLPALAASLAGGGLG